MRRADAAPLLVLLIALAVAACTGAAKRTVKGPMQPRPGAPVEDATVDVFPAPVNLPALGAEQAGLEDEELVIGVVVDGQPMAYPVRHLAAYEVVNDRPVETPIAPTW